jgi:hypothetical protein
MGKSKEPIHVFWHCSRDWCHVCGHRKELLASTDTWENAEHALLDPKTPQRKKYIRICSDCLSEMLTLSLNKQAVNAL